MDKLTFSRRGRRRARRQRVKRIAFALSVLATITSLPGATFALDALERLASPRPRRAELRGIEASESVASTIRFRRGIFKRRRPPEPTSGAERGRGEEQALGSPSNGGSVTDLVYAAAGEFGIEGGYLLSVASCESGLDPGAVNPVGYHGLFQFDQATWAAYGYGSIYDPVAQARTAARLLAAGQTSRWPNCA
jgi:soluble lytic murein transglycosylase-like protein